MEEMGVAAARRDKAIGGPISSFVFDRAVGRIGVLDAGRSPARRTPEGDGVDTRLQGRGMRERAVPCCVLSGDLTDEEAAILDRQRRPGGDEQPGRRGDRPTQQDLAVPGARLTSGRPRRALEIADRHDQSTGATCFRAARREGHVGMAGDGPDPSLDGHRRQGGGVRAGRRLGLDGRDRVAGPARLGDDLGGYPRGERPGVELREWRRHPGRGRRSADGGTTWATRDASLLTAGPTWGQPVAIPVVQFEANEGLVAGQPGVARPPADRHQARRSSRSRTS